MGRDVARFDMPELENLTPQQFCKKAVFENGSEDCRHSCKRCPHTKELKAALKLARESADADSLHLCYEDNARCIDRRMNDVLSKIENEAFVDKKDGDKDG